MYVVFIYKVPYLHACLLVVVLFLLVLFHFSNAAIFLVETSYIFSFSPFHIVLLYIIIQNSDSKFLLLFTISLYHNWWVLAPVAVINSAFCCCSGNTSCTYSLRTLLPGLTHVAIPAVLQYIFFDSFPVVQPSDG